MKAYSRLVKQHEKTVKQLSKLLPKTASSGPPN
jgi:hypothetical protein